MSIGMQGKRNMRALLDRIYESPREQDILDALSRDSNEETRALFQYAADVCARFMGIGVLCRGIVEFSNYCRRNCAYCGLRRENRRLNRYRLTDEEIMQAVSKIAAHGISTVILQSGDDDRISARSLARTIKMIKRRFDMAVTLSVGERPREDYALWRTAGADRYLLKIETTDREVYNALHGGEGYERRISCLDALRSLGYQTGSGVMTGLPGQILESISRDILFFKEYDLAMIGIGPFIPHPQTPLSGAKAPDIGLTLKAVALTRIVTRRAHIPATTALGCGDRDYRADALAAGANVLMLNFTPELYRQYYDIYPGRRRVEDADISGFMKGTACSAGRVVDYSKGDVVRVQ